MMYRLEVIGKPHRSMRYRNRRLFYFDSEHQVLAAQRNAISLGFQAFIQHYAIPEINSVEDVEDYLLSFVPDTFTAEQSRKLLDKWRQDDQGLTWAGFINSAHYNAHLDIVTVPWCGMMLVIELDGHCHS